MFELKCLNKEAIPAALEKAKQYRLLNEPSAAQSICLDILAVEPEHQEALVTIILAMTDRLTRGYSIGDSQINDYLSKLGNSFDQAYYRGIIYERRAKAFLNNNPTGNEATIFELFRQAMECFEKAEAMTDNLNDNAVLRWNECARIIDSNGLAPSERRHDFDFIE